MRERGSLSIVAITCVLVLCLGALAAADVGSMVTARARAQSAAEAAALAAAVRLVPALGQPGAPEDAARTEAEANGARLERCECTAGTTSAVVEVTVEPAIVFITPWRGRSARATATAELDPDVMSYRQNG